MKAQELLTYVEELVFKTSMFGYDKDEVDVQLDKICDEIEAIVKEKDKEIEALKKGQTIIISDDSVRLKKDEEPSAEAQPEMDEETEVGELKKQIETLRKRLQEAQAQAEAAEKQAEEAEERAATAEKKAAAAEGRAAVARTKAMAEAVAKAETAPSAGQSAPEETRQPQAEESTEAQNAPKNRDEAYEQYIRNADLLCRQLSDIQSKQDSIIKEAEEKAAKSIKEAEEKAAESLKEAEAKAAKIVEEAQVQANEILAGIQSRRAEEQKKYDELLAQKQKMLSSLKEMAEDVSGLLEKVQA